MGARANQLPRRSSSNGRRCHVVVSLLIGIESRSDLEKLCQFGEGKRLVRARC